MKNNYIQIGKDYRLSEIGDSNLFQVWKEISGGSYRKCNLNLSILNKIDFNRIQYILHIVINQFVDRKLSTRGYIVSQRGFKEFNELTTEGIINLANELTSNETIAIFYKTK